MINQISELNKINQYDLQLFELNHIKKELYTQVFYGPRSINLLYYKPFISGINRLLVSYVAELFSYNYAIWNRRIFHD